MGTNDSHAFQPHSMKPPLRSLRLCEKPLSACFAALREPSRQARKPDLLESCKNQKISRKDAKGKLRREQKRGTNDSHAFQPHSMKPALRSLRLCEKPSPRALRLCEKPPVRLESVTYLSLARIKWSRAKTPRRKGKITEGAKDGHGRLTRFPSSFYEVPSALFAALREAPRRETLSACFAALRETFRQAGKPDVRPKPRSGGIPPISREAAACNSYGRQPIESRNPSPILQPSVLRRVVNAWRRLA